MEVSSTPDGKTPYAVFGGRHIAIGWSAEPEEFIDIEEVKLQKNGKPSLWAENPPQKYIAVATIGLSLFATLIGDGTKKAALNSTIIALPDDQKLQAEAATAFLNSMVARFVFLTESRSAVLEGSSRATLYPRNLEVLPFPANLSKELETRLVNGYTQLEALAKVAKNNPNQWFLDAALEAIGSSGRKITDASFGLSFADWGEDVIASELEHDGVFVRAGLFGVSFASESIAIFVYKLLTLPSDEDAIISKKSIQALRLPDNLDAIMQEYGTRLEAFKNVEHDFMAVLAEIDEAVFEAFELTAAERAYIQQRLSSFPLNRLKPRYPWDTVSKRGIKAYTEDRFA